MAVGGRRAHHQVTFAVLAAGVAAFALLQSLVIPVLTTVQHELHTTQSAATWVLTAYLLSASIMTPILGRVGDMVGKEHVFVATLVALAVGSLLAAVASSIGVLIVARVIQGIAGGMGPVAFGIIRDEFPARKVAGAVGALASLTAVGAGLGIVLAGPIVDGLGYRWLFWLPMILTIIAAVSAVLFVPESPVRSPERISLLPAVLLSSWLVALLVALSEAPAWGWGSSRVVGLLAGAVILAAGWVTAELRAATPLIDIADDAADGRVDEQPGRADDRHRDVRDVRLPARVRADAHRGRLRVRREHHPFRADAAAVGDHDVRRRHVRWPACPPGRGQGPGGHRVPDRERGHGDPRVRAPARLADLPVQRHHGRRVRARVLGTVRAGGRRGAAVADRCRERDERQHPHDRRQRRRGGDGQHRDLPARAVRAAEGIRLHDRVRGDGRRARAGCARWPADPGPAGRASGRRAGARRQGGRRGPG